MKAQFWSFDVIFAMVVFSSSLLIVSFVWYGISNQFSLAYGLGLQTLQAQLQSLQNRITTTGSPQNWNNLVNVTNSSTWTNISVGVGSGSGSRLSFSKIMTLAAMSSYNGVTYQATKSLLGISYDYYIVINSSNSSMSMGLYPFSRNPSAVQVARQSALLNGIPVRVQVYIWTNRSFGVG